MSLGYTNPNQVGIRQNRDHTALRFPVYCKIHHVPHQLPQAIWRRYPPGPSRHPHLLATSKFPGNMQCSQTSHPRATAQCSHDAMCLRAFAGKPTKRTPRLFGTKKSVSRKARAPVCAIIRLPWRRAGASKQLQFIAFLSLSYFRSRRRHALIFYFAVWRSNSGHTDDL